MPALWRQSLLSRYKQRYEAVHFDGAEIHSDKGFLMTDLIKRLREFHMPVAPTTCCGGRGLRARPIIHPDICDEAADVIEELYGPIELVQELRDFRVAVQEYAIHPAICDEAVDIIEAVVLAMEV